MTTKPPPLFSVSLLELRPRTGRYHKIRWHLSYCLGRPVAGDAKYDGGVDAARRLRPGEVFLRSSSVEFVHPDPPPWILRYFNDNDAVVITATILPEEAPAEAGERRGRQGDLVLNGDDGGISGRERPGVFRVKTKLFAMWVVVPLPEKFM